MLKFYDPAKGGRYLILATLMQDTYTGHVGYIAEGFGAEMLNADLLLSSSEYPVNDCGFSVMDADGDRYYAASLSNPDGDKLMVEMTDLDVAAAIVRLEIFREVPIE